MLAGIHQLLALRLQIPGVQLSDDEAKDLGKKIAAVQAYYPMSVLDPKYLAWIALIGTVAKVEAPRVMLVAATMKQRKTGS